MYMTPALPFGTGFLFDQASIQPIALASAHIGSGPGVAGASAMQVKPLVPLRNSRMPEAPMSTIVAPSAMALGAALMALAILSASVALAVSSLAEDSVGAVEVVS